MPKKVISGNKPGRTREEAGDNQRFRIQKNNTPGGGSYRYQTKKALLFIVVFFLIDACIIHV